PAGLTVDTLLLGAGNARIAGSADIPSNAPVRGHLRAERMPLADIGVLAQLTTPIAGRLGFELDIAGTRAQPTLSLTGARDSLTIEQMHWTSPASGGSASVSGSMVFRELKNPRIDLRLDARGLRAVDKSGLARLDVSTGESGLTISGTEDDARLSGTLIVD